MKGRAYTPRRPVPADEARAVIPLLIYRHVTDFRYPHPMPAGTNPAAEITRSVAVLRAVLAAAGDVERLLRDYCR